MRSTFLLVSLIIVLDLGKFFFDRLNPILTVHMIYDFDNLSDHHALDPLKCK